MYIAGFRIFFFFLGGGGGGGGGVGNTRKTPKLLRIITFTIKFDALYDLWLLRIIILFSCTCTQV